MYKHILFPTDGSELSLKAANDAAELAKSMNAKITALYVVPPFVPPFLGDGIADDVHCCDAVALEDSQVCVIPYGRLEELAREFTELQRQLHRIMSREIVREHGVMRLLSGMRAEERVAAFLANLAQRLEARGFSPSALVLRMTREEIGTYLGIKLETVSRCFSKFDEDGVLEVRQRKVRILDAAGLMRIAAGAAA